MCELSQKGKGAFTVLQESIMYNNCCEQCGAKRVTIHDATTKFEEKGKDNTNIEWKVVIKQNSIEYAEFYLFAPLRY